MKRRSLIRNRAEWILVTAAFRIIGMLPPALGRSASHALFRLLDRVVPKLRRVAERNLELALPDLSRDARKRLIDGVFRSLGRQLWAVAHASSNDFATVDNLLVIENLDYVSSTIAKGKGLLFATGHLGAWELSALGFGKRVQPMDIVARPLDNPYLEAWVCKLRAQTGNRIFQKFGTLRDILRALHEQRAVGFLLDHNVISADLCFIEFFGVKTSASTVFAKIAARSGAPVVPGFALWDDRRKRFVLRFYPPIKTTGDPQQDTQAIHRQIESVIREYPDQWLWIHRRFKTRPAGEAPLY